jgi:hypothetical protein
MLDIGEGTGALVVYTSETLQGEEIEIRPHGGIWGGVHTAVRSRHVGDRVLHAGVFGSLAAGHYDLRVRPQRSTGQAYTGSHRHGHPPDAHSLAPVTPTSGPAVQTIAVPPGAVAETTLVEAPSAS